MPRYRAHLGHLTPAHQLTVRLKLLSLAGVSSRFDRQPQPRPPADLLREQADRSRNVGEESDGFVQRGRRLGAVASLAERRFGIRAPARSAVGDGADLSVSTTAWRQSGSTSFRRHVSARPGSASERGECHGPPVDGMHRVVTRNSSGDEERGEPGGAGTSTFRDELGGRPEAQPRRGERLPVGYRPSDARGRAAHRTGRRTMAFPVSRFDRDTGVRCASVRSQLR